MSLTVGIYDFFAYTIPGAFYLIIVAYAASAFGLVKIDPAQVNNVSLLGALVLAGFAFVTGFLMDPLTRPWASRFRDRDPEDHAFASFVNTNRSLKVNFSSSDWRILLRAVRLASQETAEQTERHNAINIMLRNIGFGLLLLAIMYVAYFFLVALNIWNLLLAAACLWLSVVAEKESAKFSRWYYSSIFQAAAALSLKDHVWVEPAAAPDQ